MQQARVNAKELIPTMVNVILSDEDNAYNAGEVLTTVGRDATPALIDAMIGADVKQTGRVVYALRRHGPNADAAIPVLIRLFDHNDRGLANLAAGSLPDFGPQAKQAIPSLLSGLEAADFGFRQTCAESLARIDREQAPATIAPIVQVLQKGTAQEQQRALQHLRQAGVQAKSAVPALVQLLKTEKLSFRVQIADVLAWIDATQIDVMLPTLTDAIATQMDNGNSGRLAVRLLAKLGPKAKSAVPALKEALKQGLKDLDNSIDPHTVVMCLKKIDPAADVLPIIIQSLNSADKEERNEARYLVADIYGRDALAPLNAALANGQLTSNPDVVALMKQLRPNAAN
jgi:HEAT repeat protein